MSHQRIGIVAAFSKPEAAVLGAEISSWLEAHHHVAVSEEQLMIGAAAEVDAIVVLGGDGLMMRAANAYPDVPLLGINFGKVGFLALVEQKDWQLAMEALVAGEFMIEQSSTLSAHLTRGGVTIDPGWAINDVVIRGGTRMVDIEVYIDGYWVNTYPGDGMIVSTPRGSTAYCMAAGGPILTSGVRGFALVPISCHSPIRTPMIASEDVTIELVMTNDHEASLILDGRIVSELGLGDTVTIKRGVHTFQLVKIGTHNFFEAVRTKFNFQIRPDAIPTRSRERLMRLRQRPEQA